MGRWTQQDAVAGSISDPSTVNRYVYVGGDPVNFVDPSGYSLLDVASKAVGIVSDIGDLVTAGIDLADPDTDIDGGAGALVSATTGFLVGTTCFAATAGVGSPVCGLLAAGAGFAAGAIAS